MSVFLPSAFLPGITGQMYRQFALVIAATALISAANAVTLKPTQCATWLRQPDPNAKKNFFFRGFNAVYSRLEAWYLRIVRRMVRRSGLMVVIVLVLIAVAGWGFSRVPTGFIPTEDQGYVLVSVQLPTPPPLPRTATRDGESARHDSRKYPESHTPSPSAAFPRLITTRHSPTPVRSMSCSRTGASAGKAKAFSISTTISRGS